MYYNSSIGKKRSIYRSLLPTHFTVFFVIPLLLLSCYSGVMQTIREKPQKTVFVKQISIVRLRGASHSIPIVSEPVKQISEVQIIRKTYVPVIKTVQTSVVSASDNKSVHQDTPSVSNPFLQALNDYRQKNGKAPLQWDGKLAQYAQERAALFNSQGKLDFHAGFNDLIHNQDGFHKMGFYSLGENSGYNHPSMDPVALIENSYAHSSEHNANQLSSNWSYVGIGVSGSSTDVVFGGSRM